MMIFFRQTIFLLLLISLAACSTPEKTLRPAGEKPPQPISERQVSTMQKKVALLLEKKLYRQALTTIACRNQLNQPSPGMENEFITAINGLVDTAEEAMARGEHVFAGQAFRLALAAYPAERSLRRKVRSGTRKIRIHLESCSNRLMDQGLQEYRWGELDRAIRTWKSILSFNAGHSEARKAIETATIQKKSLQVMED
ncbi:hypothetical protein Geob_2397 [Geotalea daltonii FRC-32]|uniref:Tetratricopeptide repeat protein n=1 Tax=Geotalea daltonii (strain DSM 22248 / JCM 15807 / FRC-32) TaxID=316067 RepID=B9LZJ7_GEODF|nr:hypothetical protein [Geotalea daltonii]ACM20750.1 hypothetical protein Geob_2397 [Geotalea daltonii FRC-32]